MLEDHVQRQIVQWQQDTGKMFWQAEDILVVGVSGGPDSLALLHMLAQKGLHSPDRLVVGHLDHGLRPTSGDEARAVAARCRQWHVRCVFDAVDVTSLAKEQRLSTEEAARKARYEFLGRLARDSGSKRVIVGHTADDQVETVLMHLIRGAGLDGLRGMLPVAPLVGFSDVSLVRPLLSVNRRQIMDYCTRHDLDPILDPSNRDLSFFRNRIRHELLPTLESYNPAIRESLVRTGEVIRADVDYLDDRTDHYLASLTIDVVEGVLRLDLEGWRKLPLSMRRRTLRAGLLRLCPTARDVGFVVIEQARRLAEEGQVGTRSTLPGGIEMEVRYDTLDLRDATPEQLSHAPQLRPGDVLSLPVPGHVRLKEGWRIRAEFCSLDEFRARRDEGRVCEEFLDAEMAGSLLVRTRLPGERMQPLGMSQKRAKVSDMMINEKLPAALRAGWPLVANERHPVWLVGIRLDERVRVHDQTQRVIQLRCEKPGV